MKSIIVLSVASLAALSFAACSSSSAGLQPLQGNGGADAGTAGEGGASSDAGTGADANTSLAEMSSTRSLFGSVTTPEGKVRVFDGLSDIGLQSSCEAYESRPGKS